MTPIIGCRWLCIRLLLLQLDLTRDEVNEVIKHFDKSNSGFLDYQAFMDLVGFARSRSEGGGGGVDSVAVLDDVLERLRKRISRDIKHGTTMERVNYQ